MSVGRETHLESKGPVSSTGKGVAYLDGKFCALEDAKISIFDWGFSRSDACFDFVHVWNGYIFRLEDHLDRFVGSLKSLRMSIPYARDELRAVLIECVRKSGFDAAYMHFGCSRGRPTGTGRDPRSARNWFYAYVTPFMGLFDQSVVDKGINLIVAERQRIPPKSIMPTAKNYNRLDMSLALFEAYDKGGDSALLLDAKGNIVEGPGFNIFVVKGGEVLTPKNNMLPGITRRTVIELCGELGIPLREADIAPDQARGADEVFLSSSAAGILPIAKIDGKGIGDGMAGPVTSRIIEAYWSKKKQGWHGTRV